MAAYTVIARPELLASFLPISIVMEETILKQIPSPKLFERLRRDALIEGFVRYLIVCIADQQQVIANLVTVDSEQRLGKTLLRLARALGKRDPRSIRIELKISHEELSEMVGTTRPRISMFMQRFRNRGLIETNEEHFSHYQRKEAHCLPRSDRIARESDCGTRVILFNLVQYGRSSLLRQPIIQMSSGVMVQH
jgi:Crp-like helix-turn-helix domain